MKLDIRTDRFDGRGITLEQLRAFVFVATHGGFAKAGEELGRTQPTLSLSIKRLEEDIGCRLIDRRQGTIIGLTNEGKQLLPAAKDILFRMTQALQSVRKFQLRGKIALGVPDDFSIRNLHKAISCCLEEHPELKIEITAASSPVLSALLEKQQLDMAITKEIAGQPINTNHKSILRIEPLHWVAVENKHFNNLQEIPLVIFPDGCVIRQCAINALEHVGKPYFLAYVSASFENVKSAIAHGLGIGLLPRHSLTDALCVLSSEHGVPNVPAIQLVLHVTAQGKLYTLFADYLRHSLSEEMSV
ncbi:LysR family transcriptional regulator [Xenorhabdus griffiniae]|uniref:LysR family transcriptional regulator n=1 Tax=Xenorhabdus griffiniae TaxID=351672 RepID=A0ABY9XIL7_9GAMM|nr:LysR family transcriptional regulator [Xenorhabdus griffiniae]MBD1227434.1 LysR family transcriptional regulator [Xenorhabdus griffiniae]MBE8586853.1 LysR family transcriptional regulator [Xenorhabdus griffiniae]WMV72779.1 LysR family transcriptional regulator [Xenorhabdus griffiniae]WNH02457.1 LysR family transcriptional regulator [Xenorhabdus griffiniae]